MTIATATRIIYCCIVLHLSLLQIIGIASFQLGRNNPAFLCSSKSITNAQGPRHYDVTLSPLLAELSSTTMPAENEQQQQQQEYHHRHAIFQRTNAVSKSFPIPHSDIVWRKFVTPEATNESNRDKSFWEQLLSPAQHSLNDQKQNQLVNDVTVQFDDATTGAQELVEQCQLFTQHCDDTNCKQPTLLPENAMMEQEITQHLANVLSYFQSIAGDNNSNNIKCQARIVSSIGRNGIKCPRWHADHVPVRLVMSIIGPGCEYIPHEVEVMGSGNTRLVDRNALNTLDEDDTRIANEIIVPANLNTGKTIVTSAKEGDAVLLMGRAWEDSATSQEGDFTISNNILAAVH
eukprot:CAMPEP_0201701688 /NCGR_PEP_ID=MMETSP0578-20130828/33622_1 /ASSEMBLY_ACC=CAM_ASM_000663 /TAXON_ID=267565 /ORGANISM="Skeletonema grethea, Strain CCMP 1804" /LENGTH=346 /DNA_ID=CAMNT_0048189059 /DNA_START=30 /DNA_END=1067 /DNA_ORIENTATION=+